MHTLWNTPVYPLFWSWVAVCAAKIYRNWESVSFHFPVDISSIGLVPFNYKEVVRSGDRLDWLCRVLLLVTSAIRRSGICYRCGRKRSSSVGSSTITGDSGVDRLNGIHSVWYSTWRGNVFDYTCKRGKWINNSDSSKFILLVTFTPSRLLFFSSLFLVPFSLLCISFTKCTLCE